MQKEAAFYEELRHLFDIAHANALDIITIEEDKQFLIAQRTGRVGYMAGIDKDLTAKEDRKKERIDRAVRYRMKEQERYTLAATVQTEPDTSSEDDKS